MQDWKSLIGKMDQRLTIETYEDFPTPGVRFLDIGSIFNDPDAWQTVLGRLNATAEQAFQPDFLVGLESRGFPLIGAMAAALGVGFAMCRKPGKLPGRVTTYGYRTEYSTETLEIQPAKLKGDRILIVDDVAATGGSIEAAAALIRSTGREPVGALTVFDLEIFQSKRPLSVPLLSLFLK